MPERRLLQMAIFIAALVPISAGLAGMLLGISFLSEASEVSLDSHLRYLSGLLFALGLSFWMMIPSIEKHTQIIRILTFLVVTGGIARLLAALLVGIPSTPMLLAIGMELVITPLLCFWQMRVARLKLASGL